MRYYMIADNAYIYEIGIGMSGEEISEDLYLEIMDMIRERPASTETVEYLLTVGLEWVPHQIQPVDPGDIDADMALSIILGEVQPE